MTVVEHHPSVVTIDFKAWRTQGITCVLLDVDSTVTPWLGTAVEQAIVARLAEARKAGITHIGLVTNSNRRTVARIAAIARQCGADGYFMPRRFRERKPRPTLIKKALKQFGAAAEQTALIGDKYGTDVRAAKRAGLAKVAWVDRLGNADRTFDRYLRRPIEKIIRRMIT